MKGHSINMISKNSYYISKEILFEEYIKWHKEIKLAEINGDERPQIPNYIIDSLYKICVRLSFRPNFSGYSYREEFVSDALEQCVIKAHKFNPEKSENPFGYFTLVIWRTFLQRIAKEKRQEKIKREILSKIPIEDLISLQESDEEGGFNLEFLSYLRDNDFTPSAEPLIKIRLTNEESYLEEFMVFNPTEKIEDFTRKEESLDDN